jgi:hypothetical protein
VQLADHVLVNDDLDTTVAEMLGLVEGHRTIQ